MSFSRVIQGDSRSMKEIEDSSIQLMVTSPPYWHIKDYGARGQIGYGQSLHGYLKDLYSVWKETFRVLEPGRKACINIGDQFLRSKVYGRYKIVPLHAEIIVQMEKIGFDFMGSIIWNKKTTINSTGGAAVMGSYPYPPNGIVEIDYEYILIFKKPGRIKKFDKELKEASKLSKEEWKELFLSHWNFGGTRQSGHEAMFPEELPSRLIKMYTFKGETVLDPFLGSGTTALASGKLERNCIGYEISGDFIELQKKKMGKEGLELDLEKRELPFDIPESDYVLGIPDIEPLKDTGDDVVPDLFKVINVHDGLRLELEDGRTIGLQGISVSDEESARRYLEGNVLKKKVILMEEGGKFYVYLKNRIFINKELIKIGSCNFNGNMLLSKARVLEKASR
ncbi:MAG: site-specific DNA-methyltransferase [Thermoplasmatota archaeon]